MVGRVALYTALIPAKINVELRASGLKRILRDQLYVVERHIACD